MTPGRSVGPLTLKVGANLRALRKAHGFSAHQFAQALPHRCGLTRVAISKIEAGLRGVSLEELATLATAFALDNPWDLTGELCSICSSAPPRGLRCLTCGRERT